MMVRVEPAGDSDGMQCVQKGELESGPYDMQSEDQDEGKTASRSSAADRVR